MGKTIDALLEQVVINTRSEHICRSTLDKFQIETLVGAKTSKILITQDKLIWNTLIEKKRETNTHTHRQIERDLDFSGHTHY